MSASDGQTWGAVVVGGGVAGLVAARELAHAGVRVLVLEQGPQAGGAVARHVVAGLTLDAGAESFATRGGTVAALVADLGLADRVVEPEPLGAWVQLPTGAGPLPRAGHLGIPADPWAPDVRRTIGLVGAVRATLDRVLPASWAPRGASPTLGALVRARFGPRVLDRLVRPVVGGVLAADPDDIAVDAVSPGLRAAFEREGSLGAAVRSLRALAPAGSAVACLDGGLHVLVDALVADVEAHGGTVRTGAAVTDVARVDTAAGALAPAGGDSGTAGATRDDGTRGTGGTVGAAGAAGGGAFVVTVAVADTPGVPSDVHTERVVLATPSAPQLLAGLDPELGGLDPDAGADVVLATLVLDAPALDAAPRGTGVLVTPDVRGVRAKALTHASTKWGWVARAAGPGRHVVRLSYGVAGPLVEPGSPVAHPEPRAGDPLDARDLEPDALTALALRDASTLLGVELTADQLVGSARVRWSQSLPRPSAAHREVVTAVREAVAGLPGVAVCGAWVAGNGLASVVPDARRAAAGLLTESLAETT
jgi:oxygen-dependent protoporphyrinogen oxidase